MPVKRPKASDWESPASLLLLQSWAQQGLSWEQIGAEMGRFMGGEPIASRTLRRWRQKYPATIGRSLENGREVAVAAVENALFKKAQSGDLGAICFYLKNRAPEKWSDHPELRGMSGKVVFIDDIPATKPKRESGQSEPADAADKPDNS